MTARYGIAPARLPMLSALIGEAADNLVGVTGVGLRTASKLVQRYASVAALLADLESVSPVKLRDALRDAGERIAMNEELARLRDDLDLGDGPLAAPLTAAAVERVRALFAELEFKSLDARVTALAAAGSAGTSR